MYIYRLAHAQGDARHQVDVIHCVDSYHLQHPDEPEIRYKEHPNVQRHELRSQWKWLSPLLTQQTGKPLLKNKQIQQVLDSKPYDVIHFHNISLLGPEILKILPKNREVVKLYTTHEHWLVCPMHVLWKFNRQACDKPECLTCTLMGKRPPQIWRYTGMLARNADHVDQYVSPSRFTARMHAVRGFPRRVDHLPYFIEKADSDWQSPAPAPQERPYFLFVGRLETIKGLQMVIPLWRNIQDFDLLVAGTGRQEAELRALAADNPRIRFLGPLSQKTLSTYYFHARATLVPSITYETFGVIIIESFARKTPVIVRDLGALPEVVEDSNGGIIFRTDQELIASIEKIGRSPRFRQELGENGYQAFLKYWCREAHLEMYFDLLAKIGREKYGYSLFEKEVLPEYG
jgi:glycosyltransferase involved in cell wall biosynthesis